MSNEPWKPTDEEYYAESQWREIARYPGYRFTYDGKVWSCWTAGRNPHMRNEWRCLSPYKSSVGYLYLSLRDCHGTSCRHLPVHGLIAEAFHGPAPIGMEVRHFPDRERTNNCANNLCYGTRADNLADKLAHGTDNRGEKHPLCRITEQQVKEIRAACNGGESQQSVGRRYGIGQVQVGRIVRRKRWSHVA